MTSLRAEMIRAMQMRGFSERTHGSYLAAVGNLARYFQCSPDRLGNAELNRYFEHLVTERHLAPASCRLFLNGIRFFYVEVLKRPKLDLTIALPKLPQRIPELLTCAEVGWLISSCTNRKHRMALTLCYGCGLRLSELVAVKVAAIDGERRLLRIEQGKGAKDRLLPVSETLLAQLRDYWRRYHPKLWLFPGRGPGKSHNLG